MTPERQQPLRANSGEPIDGTECLCPRCDVIMCARAGNVERRANHYARRFDAFATSRGVDLPIEMLSKLVQLFAYAIEASRRQTEANRP